MYSYDPSKIAERGIHKMRFELGDIVRDGDEFDPYLADEEIAAILGTGCTWAHAKVLCLESIVRSLSFEVDTKVGPLTLNYNDRAEMWRKMLDDARAEDVSISGTVSAASRGSAKPPYFYADMHKNDRSDDRWR